MYVLEVYLYIKVKAIFLAIKSLMMSLASWFWEPIANYGVFFTPYLDVKLKGFVVA